MDNKQPLQSEINSVMSLFSNGEFVAPELIDLKTGNSLKLLLQPKLSDNFYSPNHLIEGNKDAENKIVIFSDPLCPFCIDYVPEVIKHVKKNKEEIALYYYHFPLSKIHPAADTLVKAMDVAKKKGIKDVELKVYETDWETYFKIDSKATEAIIPLCFSEASVFCVLKKVAKTANNNAT